MNKDRVNHPEHYTQHPSGIECIEVTEHMNFNCGNAIKYIWRADFKEDPIENLQKAKWYLEREIRRRQKHEDRKSSSGQDPKDCPYWDSGWHQASAEVPSHYNPGKGDLLSTKEKDPGISHGDMLGR
jgi:hypothetical protein